ncbi:molybdopterin molybdotransferase MoeA [Nanchangia anserum]|uniref:Molybdopterin molybdenumtransferase n=1 Tax=Nanchangia anserum TaxID=2692125 RepID=A0A8I0GCN6_9ACTO|nr:gephyrin-like molybdotransferase Glp [Nanchangia anserum]MBD3689118.1 molybdopterin molybdotransferase MoeA [Nanchangia anserum]QOX81353.1 molybdopterin molybdotransferase MoeA [Nanchangia anserum]
MRTVAEHLNLCLEQVAPLAPLDVLLPDTVGCVLAEDVVAPFDRPVVDQATCDGYAVRSHDIVGARPTEAATLEVLGELRAGDTSPASLIPGAAMRIASGAPIPAGADTVVALETTDQDMRRVSIHGEVPVGSNILRRGQDVSQGTEILTSGMRIDARQVALLAGVGRLRVRVHPKPRVVVVSIGDELVEPGQAGGIGTVFDANGHALACAVADAGAQTFRVAAVPDEHDTLRRVLHDQLVRADVLVTTGGLSYGAGDTVKEVLSPLGTVRFDNVAMTPGKQFGIGTVEGVPIFCLPGDPVAAQIGYEIFVRPALRKMAGWTDYYRPAIMAKVDRGWESPAGRREFVRVRVTGTPDAGYDAVLTGDHDRLLLSALARANALAVVPEDVTHVNAGDEFYCMVLD